MSRFVLLAFLLMTDVFGAPIALDLDESQPPLAFAQSEIRKALEMPKLTR